MSPETIILIGFVVVGISVFLGGIIQLLAITRSVKTMSDTNAQVVTDIHAITAELATMRANIAAVKTTIDTLRVNGVIPADAAAELHAAVGEVQADNAALSGAVTPAA